MENAIPLPPDIEAVVEDAWQAARHVPGFLLEDEARLLGYLAACTPAAGAIVEIGSFKGRSTVMLAKVAAHYGLGQVVAIDPHTHNLTTAPSNAPRPSTYDTFLASLRTANVEQHVEVHKTLSTEVSRTWSRPVRLLWIDGDHTYAGAKADFDGFMPFVQPGAVVMLHDALNNFTGPIRVFVEEMLRSTRFGPAGFVHSIAWAQLRPQDAAAFAADRRQLERTAARLIPLVRDHEDLHGLAKIRFKLSRSRVPRKLPSLENLAARLVKGAPPPAK